jgi:hypothetical protein
MNLTLKGFLRGYCRELTCLRTDNLRKLVNAAADTCPAAAEAVMAFAVARGQAEYASRLAEGTWMEKDYRDAAHLASGYECAEDFLSSGRLPDRYAKVLDAYHARKASVDADRRVIALMREKTLDSLKSSGASIYSVCKQLSLNKGNVYAYLNGGDASKVSRATARCILEYVESL